MNVIIFSPLIGILLMVSGILFKNKYAHQFIAIAGAGFLLLTNVYELATQKPFILLGNPDLFHVGNTELVFLCVILGLFFFYLLLNGHAITRVGDNQSLYFALLFFSICGSAVCIGYNNLITLYAGLEITFVPLYILTVSKKDELIGIEAGLKFFLMGAFSSVLVLMGIALIYGGNGTFSTSPDSFKVWSTLELSSIGFIFLLSGMLFKISVVPFHFWVPDLYDGIPAAFTSFIDAVIKMSAFYAFYRLFNNAFGSSHYSWENLIIFIFIITVLIGNITAIFQQSVKRMLSYSSIAQTGFMMLAILTLNNQSRESVLLYTLSYGLSSVSLFAVIGRMSDFTISDFNGLIKTRPAIAVALTVFLVSLTGIPFTAGFQSKLFMILSVSDTGKYMWLVLIAILFIAVSSYYYFRLIQAMYFKIPDSENPVAFEGINKRFIALLLISSLIIIVTGLYPEWLIGWLYYW